ncbi:MAG: dUTP diphosphatase [Ignavibacteria bacterium]
MKIFFKIADSGSPVFIPEYKTSGSAGMDLCSSSEETILISSSEYALVSTNLILEIPEGYEGQIRPRSGLALKNGITVLNSPGTIDCDYRGEIKVLLINHGKKDFAVKVGDRIAQLIISKYIKCDLIQSEEISDSLRGDGGYGSTGTSHKPEN